MERLYSVQEMAELTGLTEQRVRQLADELINADHGQKVGKVLVLRKTASTYIKNRRDGRGRPKKRN